MDIKLYSGKKATITDFGGGNHQDVLELITMILKLIPIDEWEWDENDEITIFSGYTITLKKEYISQIDANNVPFIEIYINDIEANIIDKCVKINTLFVTSDYHVVMVTPKWLINTPFQDVTLTEKAISRYEWISGHNTDGIVSNYYEDCTTICGTFPIFVEGRLYPYNRGTWLAPYYEKEINIMETEKFPDFNINVGAEIYKKHGVTYVYTEENSYILPDIPVLHEGEWSFSKDIEKRYSYLEEKYGMSFTNLKGWY